VTVQRLVRISRARAAELAEQTRALRRNEESIATVGRELRSGARAREHIVRAARTITGGHFSVLWEAEGDGVLVSRTQLELIELRIDLAREASSAGVAFASGKRFFVPDARTHPACSPRLVEPTGVVSLLSQPVLSGDGVVGVLVVGWPDEVEESAQPLAALELLAAEAAIAIERAALEGELERAARTDALTGLSNRRVWEESCRASSRSGALRTAPGRSASRLRSLQAPERPARPPGRRPPAARSGRSLGAGAARRGPAGAVRRRGVRRAPPPLEACGGLRDDRARARRDSRGPDVLGGRRHMGRA
jgi:hypothetical protein